MKNGTDTPAAPRLDNTPPKTKTPAESAAGSVLDAAKRSLASLAEKAKEHDFKGDARKAAEGVKELKEKLAKHDLKAELREAFAETKKNPSSLWKKPETLRPGKELAVAGLAAAAAGLLLLFLASGSPLRLVCVALGVGALLLGVLGLKTEGRKLAVGSAVAGLFVVLAAFGQLAEDPEEDESADVAGDPSGEISLDDYVVTPEEMASNDDNEEDDEPANAQNDNVLGEFIGAAFDIGTGQDTRRARAFIDAVDQANKQQEREVLNLFGFGDDD